MARICLLAAALICISSPTRGQETSDELRQQMLAKARNVLVPIQVPLKLSNSTKKIENSANYDQIAKDKRSLDFMGAVIDGRTVLVPDSGIPDDRIAHWQAVLPGGKTVTLERSGFLVDAPAVLLRPIDEQITLAPTLKTPDGESDDAGSITAVVPRLFQNNWALQVRDITRYWDWKTNEPFFPTSSGSLSSGVQLLFDHQANLIGVSMADRVGGENSPVWRLPDLLEAKSVSEAQWEKIENGLRDEFAKNSYAIRIEYRRPETRSQPYADSEYLGWAIAEDILVVPAGISRTMARRIDRVSVQIEGEEREAAFLGRFRFMDLLAIRLKEGKLPDFYQPDGSADIRYYKRFIAISLELEYGEPSFLFQSCRPLGNIRSFNNQQQPRLYPAPVTGSVVLDLSGKPLGIFSRRRRPWEELDVFLAFSGATRLTQSSAQAELIRSTVSVSRELFSLDKIIQVTEESNAVLDPLAVQVDEQEEKRGLWLGVEYNPLTKALAESLECRKESKDGRIGLVVSQVYPDSPAAVLGLQPNDVLLRLTVDDRAQPIELSSPRLRSSRAPWPTRRNFFTSMLENLGENQELELQYWRGGETLTVKTKLARAPIDQSSAEKLEDKQLGLTLKPITYEVRFGLNLKPDDAGLVVTEVKSGSPAALARIRPREIVQSIDGEFLEDPKQFEELIAKARENRKEQVRLVLSAQGQLRFADLKL